MDQATRTRIEHNIFPHAHQACEPWDTFPWHAGRGGAIDTHVTHSSQALAIDVFGTIKTASDCDAILDALATNLGVPAGSPWEITLEWRARASLLNEPRPTQVDVYAENPHSVMLFECKFTEQDGGACSQTVRRNGSVPCNGNYAQQATREIDMTSRCALSEKDIQYWEIIPKVFHLDAETDYEPCPFAGPAYQWMRNLVVAYKVARQKNKQPAVVIVYADSADLPMAQKVKAPEWSEFTRTVRQDQVPFHVRSYQEILTCAQETTRNGSGADTLWIELHEWVNRKILRISENRRKLQGRSRSKRKTISHAGK
jgi:Restriction Endonuclease associating with ARP